MVQDSSQHHRFPRAVIMRFACSCAQSWNFSELSGSLGDLGTFLPLVVALAATIQLDLGTTLLFTGIYNILSGIAFGIPMCVQPMKTIAAVALAAPGLTIIEAMSAGLFVSSTMLFLGITGLMNLFNSLIPTCIVRGIQLAVGLQLAEKGIMQAALTAPHTWRPIFGVEGLMLGVLAVLFLLVTTVPAAAATLGLAEDTRVQQQQQQQQDEEQHGATAEDLDQHTESSPTAAAAAAAAAMDQCSSSSTAAAPSCCSSSSSTVPAALIVVLIGLILTPIANPEVLAQLNVGPSIPQIQIPTLDQFKSGVLKAGLAQLPLTSLNSVIAVSQLAGELFPQRVAADGWRWRPGAVAVSVGAMNLMGCWFGAFPCCHGSGGLAAQYKFGARTGTSCIMLGLMKATLALLFGSSLLHLLQHFPGPLLGSMLLLSGIELATSAKKENTSRGYCFMLLTAVAILGLGDTAIGFLVGLGSYGFAAGYEWLSTYCVSRFEGTWPLRTTSTGAAADGHAVVKYSQLRVCETA